MSDIIYLTNIQKYNDLIAASRTRKRRNTHSDLSNTAIIGKFTLSKVVEQDEQSLIKFACNLGRTIGATYLNFGSDGCVFYFNRSVTHLNNLDKEYIKRQILSSFRSVQIQQREYDYLAKEYITKVRSAVSHDLSQSDIRVIFSGISEIETNKPYTLAEVCLRTNHSWNDTLLCSDTERYGVYNVQSEEHLHAKKANIIEFNYKLGLFSQSTRHPNPVEHVNGVDVLVLLKDALQYTNSIKDEVNRPWKRDAISCILNTFKKLRWPSQKVFMQSVTNSLK
jgi:hypothetical protein